MRQHLLDEVILFYFIFFGDKKLINFHYFLLIIYILQEILDEQFVELEGLALASDEDPNFVEDTINVYFEESNELLPMIEDLL